MITQAAIKIKDVVYVGRRHPDIIRDLASQGFKTPIKGVQGFVTDSGQFLDRAEARQHFVDCGQVSTGKLHPTQLFSEDLY